MREYDLCHLPIAEAAALFRGRKLSPVELTEAYLDRIGRIDRGLHCYVTIFPEAAVAAAREAEAAFARGDDRGPLQGIPLGLKDLFDIAGTPTAANTRVLERHVAERDAPLVSALRKQGAVLLGKLQLHEFAMANPSLDDPVPPTRNPWDRDRMPGGSSSGPAAALAAGLCAGSFASDTGGSIRHPAAHCAVVGLKPTYGLVSRRGAIALSWSLDHVGPMAQRVDDVALLLQVSAGFDRGDPGSVDVEIPDYRDALKRSVRGLRIGVPRDFIDALARPEVSAVFDEAIAVFRKLGAEITEVSIPALVHAASIFLTILLAEAVAYHETWLRERGERYGRDMWLRLLPGLAFSAADYLQAQRGRALLCRQVSELMRTVDIIATPTMPQTSPTFAEMVDAAPVPRSPLTRVANLTGQPSLSLPCGFVGGLPIGLLLNGRGFEDATVLAAAHAFERATDWHLRRPDLPEG